MLRILAAVMALLAAPAPAIGGAMRVEPGLWELTISMPDPIGSGPVRQVHRTCIRDGTVTAERVNAEMKACRISNVVFQGSTAKWKIRCETPAGALVGSGAARSSGSAVAGTMEMTMALGALEIPLEGSFKGRRLGRCR